MANTGSCNNQSAKRRPNPRPAEKRDSNVGIDQSTNCFSKAKNILRLSGLHYSFHTGLTHSTSRSLVSCVCGSQRMRGDSIWLSKETHLTEGGGMRYQ